MRPGCSKTPITLCEWRMTHINESDDQRRRGWASETDIVKLNLWMHSSIFAVFRSRLGTKFRTVPICAVQQLSANVHFKDCNPEN